MRNLIKAFAAYIAKANNYNKDQQERIEYAMKFVIFEISKLLGIILIFYIMGYGIEGVIAGLTMGIIKPFMGGYHEDHHVRCFIMTLIIIGSIVYMSANVSMQPASKCVLYIACIFSAFYQAPIINPKMPLTRRDLIMKNKTISLVLIIAFAIASIVFYKNTPFSNTVLWTIVYLTLLMFEKSSCSGFIG